MGDDVSSKRSREHRPRCSTGRNALFALFIGGILAYGAGFAWYMLDQFDLVDLLRPRTLGNVDDAFYYSQIAYHLSAGKFSTFDGGITQTNGYHPLWMLLITPFYWVFDKEAALFGIKAFEIMLIAGGVVLIVLAARICRLPYILLIAALPVLYLQRGMLLGMEAAAALFMLGLLFFALSLYARSSSRWRWFLTAVAISLPWVRLEFMAISLAATAALCLIEWLWQERPPGLIRSIRALHAVAPLLGAVAGILVYFAYNGIVFGGIVPVSGATKQAWSQGRFENEGGYNLVGNLQRTLQVPALNYELLLAAGLCACILLVWWSTRHSRRREEWPFLVFLVGVFGLAAGHLAKFAQTVLTVYPRPGVEPWYFVPAYLMMALAVPVFCYLAIYCGRWLVGPKSPRAANRLSLGIIITGTLFLVVKTNFEGPFGHVKYGNRSNFQNGDRAWAPAYLITRVMNRVLPEDSIVGTWDAGIIGYFSRFPVVNLDGLVNSYDYLHAPKSYDAIGRMPPQYGEQIGITHYIRYSDFGAPDPHGNEVLLFQGTPFGTSGNRVLDFRVWAAKPPPAWDELDSNAYFWERIRPHFHFESDGVGVFVEDRMAQVLAKDCEPEHIRQKIFAFSWFPAESATAESVRYVWRDPRVNHLGYCVEAFELPHNALSPVRVEAMSLHEYLANMQPVISSTFDVYLSGNQLTYVKERCKQNDVDARFFLHLDPVNVNDLPGHRKQYGFDNLDFDYRQFGGLIEEGICVVNRDLPDYDIAAIRTGQYVPGEGQVWEGVFMVGLSNSSPSSNQ